MDKSELQARIDALEAECEILRRQVAVADRVAMNTYRLELERAKKAVPKAYLEPFRPWWSDEPVTFDTIYATWRNGVLQPVGA